jgi:hypothetical protein
MQTILFRQRYWLRHGDSTSLSTGAGTPEPTPLHPRQAVLIDEREPVIQPFPNRIRVAMQRVRVKALDRLTDLTQDVRLSLTVGTSSMIYLRIIVHPADKPRHASFLELPVAGKQPEPQKADSPPHGPRSATEVQFQPQAVTRERPDLRLPFQNRCLCVCEHQHVVHVAHVVAHLQNVFHILIQFVQVQVGEKLTRQVSQRNAAKPATNGNGSRQPIKAEV